MQSFLIIYKYDYKEKHKYNYKENYKYIKKILKMLRQKYTCSFKRRFKNLIFTINK